MKKFDIIQAIKDEDIFRPYLGEIKSWTKWFAVLRCVYGIPPLEKHRDLIRECTGRDPGRLPIDGFRTSLFLTGRRSGKSRIVSIIAAFEALFAGHEKRLAKGEKGLVVCISPTRRQSNIVRHYIRSIFDLPVLKGQLVSETKEAFELANGIRIDVMTADWRTCRGFTVCAAVVDEICFFGLDEEAKVRSDTELIRAIKPSLMTTKGKLICISSPYAKKGWAWEQYQKCIGNDHAKTLVWNAASRTMNPTLDQVEVDEAIAEDPESGRAEYLGEFRDDIAAYITRELVERCVVDGRDYISPKSGVKYYAFVDMSGGRSDAAALAIGHRGENNKVVVDYISHYKAPFVPDYVISLMAGEIKRYNVHKVTGDNYAGEYTSSSFERHRLRYERCEKPKSELYYDLLPRITSEQIVLPDNERLIKELSTLERRTRSGGRDSIDHPRGAHDDIANTCAGLAHIVWQRRPSGKVFVNQDSSLPSPHFFSIKAR